MEDATVATGGPDVEVPEVQRLSDFSKVTNLGERLSSLSFIDTLLLQFKFHVYASRKFWGKYEALVLALASASSWDCSLALAPAPMVCCCFLAAACCPLACAPMLRLPARATRPGTALGLAPLCATPCSTRGRTRASVRHVSTPSTSRRIRAMNRRPRGGPRCL